VTAGELAPSDRLECPALVNYDRSETLMIDETAFVAKLTALFREELDQPSLAITLETQRADIESWDSLAHVRLVIGIERAFDVQLDVAEIESIDSVRAFYRAVSNHSK
jgi:acyl carrier protein